MAYIRQFAEFNGQTGDTVGLWLESDAFCEELKKRPFYGIWLCSPSHNHRVRILGKESWPGNRKIINRITPEYSVNFVVSGTGFMNGIPLRRGDVFLAEPGLSHSIISSNETPLVLYWLIFERWFSAKFSEIRQSVFADSPVKHLNHPQRRLIYSIFEMVFDYGVDLENETKIGFLANSIVSVLATEEDSILETGKNKIKKDTNHILHEAMYYINANYCFPLSISYLAKKQYISPSYLYRLFKEHLGISPQEYILNKRLEEGAKYLANHHNIKVRDVANNVGYKSYSTFEKAFKKKYDLSPLEYRRKVKIKEILPEEFSDDEQ